MSGDAEVLDMARSPEERAALQALSRRLELVADPTGLDPLPPDLRSRTLAAVERAAAAEQSPRALRPAPPARTSRLRRWLRPRPLVAGAGLVTAAFAAAVVIDRVARGPRRQARGRHQPGRRRGKRIGASAPDRHRPSGGPRLQLAADPPQGPVLRGVVRRSPATLAQSPTGSPPAPSTPTRRVAPTCSSRPPPTPSSIPGWKSLLSRATATRGSAGRSC